MKVIVTRKENASEDDEGNIILQDEDAIGYAVRAHVIPFTYTENVYVKDNPDDENSSTSLQTVVHQGVKSLFQVHWEMERTPAFKLEAPEDLYWLKFDDEEEEEEEFETEGQEVGLA